MQYPVLHVLLIFVADLAICYHVGYVVLNTCLFLRFGIVLEIRLEIQDTQTPTANLKHANQCVSLLKTPFF